MKNKNNLRKNIFVCLTMLLTTLTPLLSASAAYRFGDFKGRPPIHQFGSATNSPAGLTPTQVKAAYGLPATGGKGTIAIVGAYDDSYAEKDLAVFDAQYNLPSCTSANGCFERHLMGKSSYDSDWGMETALDIEWAHAIAPNAKILLVEAITPSGQNFMDAIDYASKSAGVVAVSMSWGGPEFSDEASLDSHFKNANSSITFFASSGDSGAGVNWPAVSPFVTAVGGTTLSFAKTGSFKSETAWTGSGGGVSAYEAQPAYQKTYSIPKANGFRAIPDVSYNADPHSGYAVYHSTGSTKNAGYVSGGTSAGAPQWAAIKSLGKSADNNKFYADKASINDGNFFRDILAGSNGNCGYYCQARAHYDYITGLGSPLAVSF